MSSHQGDGSAGSDPHEDPTAAVPDPEEPTRITGAQSAPGTADSTQVEGAQNPYQAPGTPAPRPAEPGTSVWPSSPAPIQETSALPGYPPPDPRSVAPPVVAGSYAYPAFPGAPPGYRPVVQSSNNAVAALVLSILSWLLCPVLPAIVALVLAGKASRDIQASNGWLTGSGMVTWARVLSWVNIAVVGVLFIILFAVGAMIGGTDPTPPSEFST